MPLVNEISCVYHVDHPRRQHITTTPHDDANDEERKEEKAIAATLSLVPDAEDSIEAEVTMAEGRIGKAMNQYPSEKVPMVMAGDRCVEILYKDVHFSPTRNV